MGKIINSLKATKLFRFIAKAAEDDIAGTAAKTAFFLTLALFPLLLLVARALSLAGRNLDVLEGFLPQSLLNLFSNSGGGAFPAGPIWLLGALWAASSGILALMRGVGAAYGVKSLPFLKSRFLALLFTLGFILTLTLTIAIIAAERVLFAFAAFGAVFLLLFLLYTKTPGVSAKPRRAVFAALAASGGWMLVSRGFEVYMRYFSSHDALYGSIGVFLGICIWVFLISLVVVLGAELGGSDV